MRRRGTTRSLEKGQWVHLGTCWVLSFLGAFRRRCFTDDCANFMVRRSVWEEKETDKDQLMDMSELEGKYVWNKSWRGQQQNPGDGLVYTLLYKQTLDKPWKDKGGKETRTLLRTTEWSSRTGAEERPLVIWSRKPVVTFERRVLVELL